LHQDSDIINHFMVSIIITAYNYEKYTERAIRSCLDQSLSKSQYEIIVVNDCSTDNTSRILENYNDSIKYFNLDKNVGLAAARNFGIKKAKGQFVVFLDADDYIQHDLLLIQKTFLTENSSLDAVSVDYYLVNERGNHLEHVNAEDKPIACGIMFRKDLLIDIGLYDETFRAREEEDLRLRFLKKHKIYNIILPLYRYRMHNHNLTKNKTEMIKYKKKLSKKHGNS
jgi:glycosyltransferase involved in cell wall biosynthesis